MPASVDRVDSFLPAEAFVPKGPSGLWAALVRSGSTPAPTDHVGSAEVIELASVAHLGYLARLAPPVAVVAQPCAEVVDLDAFRARRSA